MATIEIIIISITGITAIAGIFLAFNTIINTRKKYYKDFIQRRRNKKK